MSRTGVEIEFSIYEDQNVTGILSYMFHYQFTQRNTREKGVGNSSEVSENLKLNDTYLEVEVR